MRVLERHRFEFIAGDDYPHPELGEHPQPGRETLRQADAAVRSRVTDVDAYVHGDARPGDALHVGHRRAAIDIGMVVAILLDDAEHAHRGGMTGHSGRYRRLGDLRAVAIEV